MRIAYFDPIGGASGDMIVASLLDAGADLDALKNDLAALGLDEFELEVSKAVNYQISCTHFNVHTHEHHHHSEHEGHSHKHGRHFADINKIIESSNLPSEVKEMSLKVFRALGESEAKVHGTTIEKIHFHEVGAVDSIVDIVSACCLLFRLGIEKVYVAPLPLSRGSVKCAHGDWPVPGPATMDLLKGFRWRNTDIEGELVTPTAGAVFSVFAEDSDKMPQHNISAVGYGGGTNDYGIPNVLRVCIGETEETQSTTDKVLIIETSLDDQNPQLLEHTMTRLFDAGALDVWFEPVQMKKNRPAIVLRMLGNPCDLKKLSDIILQETTTLGIRFWEADRYCLERDFQTVQTSSGPVRIKIAILPGGGTKFAPEYDDVRRIAEESGRPAREIYLEALSEFQILQKDTKP